MTDIIDLSSSAGWTRPCCDWLAATQVRTDWAGVGRSLTADSLAPGERRELLGRAGQSWVGKFKCRQIWGAGLMLAVRSLLGHSHSQLRLSLNEQPENWTFLLIIETLSSICYLLCVNIAVRYQPTPTSHQADASLHTKQTWGKVRLIG